MVWHLEIDHGVLCDAWPLQGPAPPNCPLRPSRPVWLLGKSCPPECQKPSHLGRSKRDFSQTASYPREIRTPSGTVQGKSRRTTVLAASSTLTSWPLAHSASSTAFLKQWMAPPSSSASPPSRTLRLLRRAFTAGRGGSVLGDDFKPFKKQVHRY